MEPGLELRFEDPTTFADEYVRNIEKGGAFVRTTQRWELRAVVDVTVVLAWCGERVRLEAEIVHTTPQGTPADHAGVAVQFLEPAGELRERLGRFVIEAEAPPAEPLELEREPPGPTEALELEAPRSTPSLELEMEAPPSDPSLELEIDVAPSDAAPELEMDAAPSDPAPELEMDSPPSSDPAPELEMRAEPSDRAPELEMRAEPSDRAPELEMETEASDAGVGLDLEGAAAGPGAPALGLEMPAAERLPAPGDWTDDRFEARGAERRKAERNTARLRARVEATHLAIDGHTRDLSETGVLLSTDGNDLPLGKPVNLSLTHPVTGERLDIGGTVARHVEARGTVVAVGIEFDTRLDGDEHLRDFIGAVKAAEATKRESGISGQIEEVGMANLLQMFGSSPRGGTLTICSGAEEGVLAFQNGRLLWARLGALQGVKALARLLSWERGVFEFVGQVDETDHDEALPLDAALLEAARQVDEANRVDGSELPATATLRIDREVLAGAGGALSQVEEAVLDLAAAGLSVRRLLDVIPESDGDILEAIQNLRRRGVLALVE